MRALTAFALLAAVLLLPTPAQSAQPQASLESRVLAAFRTHLPSPWRPASKTELASLTKKLPGTPAAAFAVEDGEHLAALALIQFPTENITEAQFLSQLRSAPYDNELCERHDGSTSEAYLDAPHRLFWCATRSQLREFGPFKNVQALQHTGRRMVLLHCFVFDAHTVVTVESCADTLAKVASEIEESPTAATFPPSLSRMLASTATTSPAASEDLQKRVARLETLVLELQDRIKSLESTKVPAPVAPPPPPPPPPATPRFSLSAGCERSYDSQIEGDFNGWEGETIVRLTDGQVWQQTDFAFDTHIAFMPKVLIFKDGSTCKMKVEGLRKPVAVRLLR